MKETLSLPPLMEHHDCGIAATVSLARQLGEELAGKIVTVKQFNGRTSGYFFIHCFKF